MKRPLLKDVQPIVKFISGRWRGFLDYDKKCIVVFLRKNQEEITNIEKELDKNGFKMTFERESIGQYTYKFYITKK